MQVQQTDDVLAGLEATGGDSPAVRRSRDASDRTRGKRQGPRSGARLDDREPRRGKQRGGVVDQGASIRNRQAELFGSVGARIGRVGEHRDGITSGLQRVGIERDRVVAAGVVEDEVTRWQEPGIGATKDLAVCARLDVEHRNLGVDQPCTGVPDREQRVPPVGQEPRALMTRRTG